uniref:Uncharacterized protein n=1 Tax=Cacopsylla melanoneura TaxID=428564 RepID=A0A8D9AWU9_9HEMI
MYLLFIHTPGVFNEPENFPFYFVYIIFSLSLSRTNIHDGEGKLGKVGEQHLEVPPPYPTPYLLVFSSSPISIFLSLLYLRSNRVARKRRFRRRSRKRRRSRRRRRRNGRKRKKGKEGRNRGYNEEKEVKY